MCDVCVEELKKPISWAQYSYVFRNGFETYRDISKAHTDKLSAENEKLRDLIKEASKMIDRYPNEKDCACVRCIWLAKAKEVLGE